MYRYYMYIGEITIIICGGGGGAEKINDTSESMEVPISSRTKEKEATNNF